MRLIGTINGVDVIFTFIPPNKFTAEIPRTIDGQYIVQLHAIDDAGNISNFSEVYMMIKINNMRAYIVNAFHNTNIIDDLTYEMISCNHITNILDTEYSTMMIDDINVQALQ